MMIVLLLCVIMKIAEFSAGRVSPTLQSSRQKQRQRKKPPPLQLLQQQQQQKQQHEQQKSPTSMSCRLRQDWNYYRIPCDKCMYFLRRQCAGKGAAVMEDPQTPGSDCNSNPATDSMQQDLIGSDFIQDNVEYQWCTDYGYRDGGLHVHPSVLSTLSASYTREDVGYYDDLSRNLDANLAEIDMESFRSADIHTLLTALPVMCTDPVQHSEFNYQRERYASISSSVMEKLDIGSSISPHTSSQGEESACSTTDTMSICKSSLLFSPVKETPVLPPAGSYSVDSLDCEDMLLTCQANNKNNYTIAFEASITMYSDSSPDFEHQEKPETYEVPEIYYKRKGLRRNILDSSMACSDSKIYTTWSNLKHTSMNKVITRHPSGNNNTIPNFLHGTGNTITSINNKRSQSLPDLSRIQESPANIHLNFSVDSAESNNHPLQSNNSGSAMSRSVNEENSDGSGNNCCGKKLQNLSLVKLFMKQKSMSAEGMSLTLDQSDSISDNGWPTSNSASDSATANTNTQIQRQNLNNTCTRPLPEKDFSINWVRSDCYTNKEIESQKDKFADIPNNFPSNKENKDGMISSASVEELSESIVKSELVHDSDIEQIDFEISQDDLESRGKNVRVLQAENKCTIVKTTGIQAMVETEDNEVQTSIIYKVPAEKDSPSIRETIVNKRPVYVVYPNYTLPDLSFLNIKDTKLDNVALKPQCYDKSKAGWKHSNRCSRPFSCNDIDALKQRGFSHVKDWESLTFLLPTEYKKILHDVPEVSQHININEQIKKPLFCLSPPMRHKTRPISELIPNNSSSTSSTATQPSSGYRGSSTILTDSSTNQQLLSNNIANPLYLYRYDSISSEASLVSNDKKMHRAVNQAKQQVYPNLPKRSISLPYGDKEADCCNGKVPPRPPLPRSILRKNKVPTSKRYSMFEMGGVDEVEDQCPEPNKRMSLHEPYYMNNDLQMLCRGRIIDSEKDVDETEEKCNTERLNEAINNTNVDYEISQNSEDDVKQLEEFLKRSGLSSESSEGDNEDPEVKLRSYVRKFLALRMNKDVVKNIDMAESQKKTVSFALHERKRYSNEKPNNISVTTNEYNKDKCFQDTNKEINPENKMDLEEKRNMILSVSKSVDLLLIYWNTEPTNGRQNYNDKNECAQLCLSNLCPALYTIMSDGLKPHLQSTFGPLANSVWQVVEASAQQGPLTKTLNELVQKINGEDIITEGMLKFHAFVFGLLNLRALDAWFAYLCTRESILRKHYNSNSLFTGALGNTDIREIVDSLLDILHPLAFCPFQLDLLYQYRQLHNSFGNMNNYSLNGTNFRNIDLHQKDHHYEKTDNCGTVSSPRKIRPRSCVVYNDYDDKSGITHKIDHESVVKKRFNNAIGTTKVLHGLEKLASEDSEDYTDSLEHSPLNRGAAKQTIPIKVLTQDSKMEDEDTITGEAKFRKLQEKWESMVGKDESVKNQAAPTTLPPLSPMRTPANLGKSKIPRLLTSPIKQPNVTIGSAKSVKSPITGIPSLKKPVALSTTKTVLMKPIETTRGKGIPETRRTSRVDQDVVGTSRTHLSRPSSLPYKSYGVMSKEKNLVSPQRRAASTSLPRPNTATRNNISRKQPLKDVRTVTNRAPSNNGHLSFAEGERLKVILEIDNKWLLCERGDRKGLVPRMCVHTIQT